MRIIGVTDDRKSVAELVENLTQIEPFIDALILREKSKTDEQLTEIISQLAAKGFPLKKLIIHANPALANSVGIKNVQLTSYGMSARDVQHNFPSLQFGCSIHSIEEALQAQADGASWLLYGHVYATPSKAGITPRGTDELFEIVTTCTIPVYAIGGIQPEHLATLQQHGIAGVAILSPLNEISEAEKYLKVVSSLKSVANRTK